MKKSIFIFLFAMAACHLMDYSLPKSKSLLSFDPSNISPDFWLNGTDSSKIKFINTTLNLIDTFKTSEGNNYFLVPKNNVAPFNVAPAFNGEAINSNTFTNLKIPSNKTIFSTLHNGSAFTIYFNFRILKNDPNGIKTIFTTTDDKSSNIGFNLAFDDRSQLSHNNRILFEVFNGGQVAVSLLSSDNIWTPNQYNWGKIISDGTHYSLYINGSLAGSVTRTKTLSSANATLDPSFFNTSTQTINGLPANIKNILTWNRQLTSSEQTSMDGWIATQMQTYSRGDINVYLFVVQQSNGDGKATNSTIASDLTGILPALMLTGYTYGPKDYWRNLQLGVNQTPESPSTVHGFEMRFAHEMGNIAIIKVAKSSTPTIQISGSDWNVASIGEMFTHMNVSVDEGLTRLANEFNYNPVIRGFITMQGETNANLSIVPIGSGAQWESDFENILKGFIDFITTSSNPCHDGGWNVSKMRIMINRIQPQTPAEDPTELANVQAGQVLFGTSGFTIYHSYNTSVKGYSWTDTNSCGLNSDLTHYNSAGQDSLGRWNYNYFKNYVSE